MTVDSAGINMIATYDILAFEAPSPTTGGEMLTFFGSCVRPPVRAAVHALTHNHACRRHISVFSGVISTKLDTNIHDVSGHCWKGL